MAHSDNDELRRVVHEMTDFSVGRPASYKGNSIIERWMDGVGLLSSRVQ